VHEHRLKITAARGVDGGQKDDPQGDGQSPLRSERPARASNSRCGNL